jgi:tRNA U34 5-carboxymethylaminomethyl modifying GTPase MnmE/TrmE
LRELCFYIFSETREELTFVLIGALGSGKSSTGNSILGHKHFKVSTGTMPVTNRVERESVSRNGLKITVVDTPGLENLSSIISIKHGIDDMFHRNKPTNIIYLITIKIGRYTKEEREILDYIFKNQRAMMRNVMIIFTNRNELMDEDDPADQNVDAWIGKNPKLLKLINSNKLKYLAFENKRSIEEEKDLQVKDLLSVVDDIDKKDVSWNRNMENKIYVDKKTMVETFGQCGGTFFEEQILKQNNK